MNNDHWEYHVEHSDEPLSETHVSGLGAQGWELAAALPTAGHYIFKRIAPDLPETAPPDHRDALKTDEPAG